MSKKSLFAPGKAIRGGIPLIFPWFGPNQADSKLPAHGFARTRLWELRSVTREAATVKVELSLGPTSETRQLWPHDFDLRFSVTVGPALEMSLSVGNSGSEPFRFEEAMHTYLAVDDVRNVKIQGLAGREYIDKVQGGKIFRQGAESISIVGETDRVYLATPDAVTVTEATGREIVVSKEGSDATVVWNPWIAKAKAMADFGDDEWPGMLCIETANAASHAVTLAPGEQHLMHARISTSA